MPLVSIETYSDLLRYLQCNPSILNQTIQAAAPQADCDKPRLLLRGICIGTVREFEIEHSVGNDDGSHNPDAVIIGVDHCFYNEHGDYAMEWHEDGTFTGMQSGLKYDAEGRIVESLDAIERNLKDASSS